MPYGSEWTSLNISGCAYSPIYLMSATEVDYYRGLAYIGGVPTSDFLSIWTAGIRASCPRWSDTEDVKDKFSKHPTYDDYCKKVEVDVESIRIPMFLDAAQMLIFHHRSPGDSKSLGYPTVRAGRRALAETS